MIGSERLRAREADLQAEQQELSARLRRVSEEEMQRHWVELQREQESVMDRAREDYEAVMGRLGSPVIMGQNIMMGAQLAPLNPDLAQYFPVDEGVFVVQVMQGTPASDAGLQGGDVIVRVGGEEVTSLSDLRFGLGTVRGAPSNPGDPEGEPGGNPDSEIGDGSAGHILFGRLHKSKAPIRTGGGFVRLGTQLGVALPGPLQRPALLLVAERHDRIQPGSPASRPDPEEEADGGRESQRHDHGVHSHRRGLATHGPQEVGPTPPDAHPQDATQQAESQRFDQELKEDIGPGGTHGFPDTDLPGSLRDAHQHDVHDTDAAHQEAHRPDAGKEEGEGLSRLFEGREQVGEVPDFEVGIASRGESGALSAGYDRSPRTLCP